MVAKVPSFDDLVVEEAVRVEKFYQAHPTALLPPQEDVLHYVETVAKIHEEDLRRWGGWEYRFGPVRSDLIARNRYEEAFNFFILAAQAGRHQIFHVKDLNNHPPDVYIQAGYFPSPFNEQGLYLCREFRPINPEAKEEEVRYSTGEAMVRIRRGQPISRPILADVKKRYADKPTYIKAWERFFECLGQYWGALDHLSVRLSVAPTLFLKMGHYGEKSCYQTGGSWERGKLHLSHMPGSFSALIHRGKNPDWSKVAGRAWGIKTAGGIVLSNLYLEHWGKISEPLRRTLSEGFGDEVVIDDSPFPYVGEAFGKTLLYVNKDSRLWPWARLPLPAVATPMSVIDLSRIANSFKTNGLYLPKRYACNGCAQRVLEEESNLCGRCERRFCEGCLQACQGCDRIRCEGCRGNWVDCDACDIHKCRACSDEAPDLTCGGCGSHRCACMALVCSFKDCTQQGCQHCVRMLNGVYSHAHHQVKRTRFTSKGWEYVTNSTTDSWINYDAYLRALEPPAGE